MIINQDTNKTHNFNSKILSHYILGGIFLNGIKMVELAIFYSSGTKKIQEKNNIKSN